MYKMLKKIKGSTRVRNFNQYLWDFFINGILASYLYSPTARTSIISRFKISVGRKSYIHARCYIGSAKLKIGDFSYINRECFIDNSHEYVLIGSNTAIGYKSTLLTCNHDMNNMNRRAGNVVSYPILIGDGVWIGANVKIMPGVKIGNGVVVASGSVVTKDCEENCLYAGIPAKKIKNLGGEY